MGAIVYFLTVSLIFQAYPGRATIEVYTEGGEIKAVGNLTIFPTSAQSEYEKSYWQKSTAVPKNYTDVVINSFSELAISPSPSKSRDNFVTSLQCDATKVNAVACLKVFPLTPTSRYERLYCMPSVLIRQKTKNKHSCNCEKCTPDVHCWVSCQNLAAFGEAPDSECFCTPVTGGDGNGPIPVWCKNPQGQTEFFTHCHSPLFNYSCELYRNFFDNGFSLSRDHYTIWKSFSCKGATTERLLISCLSKALVIIVKNTSVPCDVPFNEATSCLESFRRELIASPDPICKEAVYTWDKMSTNSFQLSNAEFEKEFGPARSKVYDCLRIL
ncbi:uncharacterized protein [Argopecten irradians]|uniref:uncharacterized protein n=1 Tax=Argopecten irradians TaxID=31199 RepID=UPI003713E009